MVPSFAGLFAPCLDLGDRMRLVTLQNDQIARFEPRQNVIEIRFARAIQFGDQRPSFRRYDGDLAGTGGTVAGAVGAAFIDGKSMVRVLDGGDADAAPRELFHQPDGQRRLAGVLPADDTDNRNAHL